MHAQTVKAGQIGSVFIQWKRRIGLVGRNTTTGGVMRKALMIIRGWLWTGMAGIDSPGLL